jgi:GxxExxY protein
MRDQKRSLIYEEKTELLRRGLFDVQNGVGVGRREEAYHRAYRMWLDDEAVPYRSKAPHDLELAGEVAHTLYPDFVAWDAITIELKALPRRLRDEERVQIFDYLKCRGDRLGLLVNMGLDRVHVERFVYDPPVQAIVENWEHWTDGISGNTRQVGSRAREALLAVFREHSTGYGTEVTAKLIECSLRRHGLPLRACPTAPARFRGRVVHNAPLDCLLVDECVLLVFTALFDSNAFNVSRGLSYIAALGLEWGIAANFGKKNLEMTGLRGERRLPGMG